MVRIKIQSLSVTVPNAKCVNNCRFCVSQMHSDRYQNRIDGNLAQRHQAVTDFMKRLDFARDNGCNTLMLTGTSEPQQNTGFLMTFGMMLKMMQRPFRWVEIQTTGTLLDDDKLVFLRDHVGINLISLSISSFDNKINNDIIRTQAHALSGYIELEQLCRRIKHLGFGLRLSLNLTNEFKKYVTDVPALLKACKNLGADQVTLRHLYASDDEGTTQSRWVKENGLPFVDVLHIRNHISRHGIQLGVLPHGAVKYSIDGLCVVTDTDCMSKSEKSDETYKYLILQPDCKLYSQWDDPASLIF